MNKKDKGAMLYTAFPKKIQKLVHNIVKYENYNEEYLLTSMLSAVASAAGNAVQIRIKGEWVANSALYAILVGGPGIGKSHPLDFAYKPIRHQDKKYRDEYVKVVEENEKTKKRNGAVVTPRIVLKRTILSDFTPEALLSSHAGNLRGITVLVDEIMGMFASVNQYSKGQLIEQLLTAYSGKALDVARVSMELPLHIEHPCLNIIGTAQTKRIIELFREGYQENGLIDRFLFSYPLNMTISKWDKRKQKSTKIFFEEWEKIVNKILELPYDEEERKWKELRFTTAARDHFFDWHNEAIDKLLKGNLDTNTRERMMKSHLNVARLALIIQMMRWACNEAKLGSVDLDSLKSAIQISEYFDDCYIRIGNFMRLQVLKKGVRKLFEGVDNHFSTAEAIKIGKEIGMSDRNVKYYLSTLTDYGLIRKIEHGKYQKILNL